MPARYGRSVVSVIRTQWGIPTDASCPQEGGLLLTLKEGSHTHHFVGIVNHSLSWEATCSQLTGRESGRNSFPN